MCLFEQCKDIFCGGLWLTDERKSSFSCFTILQHFSKPADDMLGVLLTVMRLVKSWHQNLAQFQILASIDSWREMFSLPWFTNSVCCVTLHIVANKGG